VGPQRDTDALERAARSSWRAFRRGDLLALGYSAKQIRTMLTTRRLQRYARGIYVLGHPDLP
jgi:hypothetical protein